MDSEELDKALENKKSMAKMNKERVSKLKQEGQPGVWCTPIILALGTRR